MNTDVMTSRPPFRIGRRLGAVVGAGLLVLALGNPASAKEVGSGGGGVTAPAACSPVSRLTAKSDPRAGETGFATSDVSYGVKPCTNGQAVTVAVSVYETLNPASVVYSDPAAALNGKFTVVGIKARTSYTVKVVVTDAATGAVAGTGTITTAAIPKGV